MEDFRKRIEHYQAQYESLDEAMESDYSFMKIFNCGKKVLVHKHEGHIQSRIVYYLMNIHIVPRTIYLCRHGEYCTVYCKYSTVLYCTRPECVQQPDKVGR